MNSAHEQIRAALSKHPNGLTARQLHSQCDESGELQELAVDLQKLKTDGKVKADGMRDSQVVYKLGNWPKQNGEDVSSVRLNAKEASAPTPKRSGSSLREGLFDMMERLRDGKVDVGTAKAYAALAMTICKSIEIQLEYERMKLSKELPDQLGDMTMVPALEQK